MPRLDSHGRLIIPAELRKEVGWTLPKDIALCYNFQNATINICDKSDIVDKYVISFRRLDSKGRLFLPSEVLDLLGIEQNALFIIFLKNNELCIKGMDGTRTWF